MGFGGVGWRGWEDRVQECSSSIESIFLLEGGFFFVMGVGV